VSPNEGTGMPALPQETRDEIARIPGEDGWWRTDGQDMFESAAVDLIAHGFTSDQAVALLGDLYGAVAEEYGE